MNIKTYIAMAVVALTAACNQVPQEEATEANLSIELNDDGSVAPADDATEAAK